MYPHERSLVQALRGAPFALVGVNSDTDLAKLRPRLAEEQITWRSWTNQQDSGRISDAWKVNAWPTLYVIDHHGVIRYKNVRGAEMEAALQTLLAEMERDAGARLARGRKGGSSSVRGRGNGRP